ncbi:hypothetical protein C8J55DRAFT_439106 [Lentinula edodes]|uniref:ubiquitinyl hydrolase 1 n=1 Tax=Lentinula lateritia TaxID=40482 RepID=A0A9W9DEY8_9AGAR|nr:hypothetical protein C8J55DRAFT_439106 [Lentinula edodes]
MGYTSHQLRYAIDHIFLPPKLPQENDQRGELDHVISSLVMDASRPFRTRLEREDNRKWGAVLKTLRGFRDLQTSNTLVAKDIAQALKELSVGDSLALFIRAQNAGVIIPEHILSSTGKLVRSFPGPAIELPAGPFDSTHFCKEFGAFLAEMNNTPIVEDDEDDGMGPRRKSGLSANAKPEETADPVFITSVLTGIMRGLGGKPEIDVTRISKRVADDVVGRGSDKKPWRRSALWLVLRVALQTTLAREDPTHRLYKLFILFLHGHILSLALKDKFDSDILFTMRAKTCRRLAKLGDDAPESLVLYTTDISERVGEELQRRWRKIQAVGVKPASVLESPWAPDQLNIPADTTLRLTNSTARINLALGNSQMNLPPTHYEPHETERLRDVAHFGDLTSAKLDVAFRTDPFVNLADFENLVGQGFLASWLERRIAPNATLRVQDNAAILLYVCMRKYHFYAALHYKSSPEDLSLMVLTLFELWVAIDKVAVASVPLLETYLPEVPFDRSLTTSSAALLRPLLIRKSVDLKRILRVNEYIRSRKEGATSNESVFSERITSSSFSVRYFDQDNHELRDLKTKIERDAQEQRNEILEELETKTQQRAQIQKRWACAEHDHTDESRLIETRQTGKRRKRTYVNYGWDCEKCRLETQMNAFSVPLHEWPLPEDENQAKRVVFELCLPRTFAQWRAATATLLFDACTPTDKREGFDQSRPHTILPSSKELSGYLRAGDDELHIMTLASTSGSAKQFNSISLPVTAADICLPNGMKWRLYEPRNKIWVRGSTSSAKIGTIFREADTTKMVTLPISSISSSIYSKAQLQYAISATTHLSNDIIACQDVCPPQLSLHEYMSFASLRSGARLQWMNLLRELREGTLSWQNEEVGTLISMLMWQVGCIKAGHGEIEGTRGFEWHTELRDLGFGQALLRELANLLRRVEGNWKEVVTVRTIVLLTSRLLTSTRHAEVILECYRMMREARKVTWEWVDQLEQKLQGCGEEFVKDYQAKICEMACACRTTYNVDTDEHLLSCPEDVAIFVACGIIIHDNKPHDLLAETVSGNLRRTLQRDRRLAHGVEPVLLKLFSTPVDEGLNQALKRIWPVYNPAVDWLALAEPNHRWVTCETLSDGSSRGNQAQEIHLDLLTGKLLVNGKPLGRLPSEFVKHPAYVRVFGKKKILDVVPASEPGMQFATRSLVSGYQVLFGMRGENDLVIRAKFEDTLFELIPHTHFVDDLPERFVTDNVHWLNLSNEQIELRSLETIWETSPINWTIHFSEPQRPCVSGTRALVDVKSWTFQMIAATMEPFEKPQFLTVTCSKNYNPSTLSVDLPRYRLSFFRNASDQLECVNFPGMIVNHDDQSVGALVGLQNRLVLKGNDRSPAGTHQKVLVPFGEVQYNTDGENHVKVEIETLTQRDVRCADYDIDLNLGCLRGNGSLKSRLYHIYLLALTSHCLPDPLTGHTGTEEALLEFYSAACMSFRELCEDEVTLLLKIGKLTPNRFGAPQHSPKSQNVAWTHLPPLSHHHAFATRAREVLGCAQQQEVFTEFLSDGSTKKEKKVVLPTGNQTLDTRGALRSAMFYTTDIKAQPLPLIRDGVYSARDTELISETATCSVASNIFTGHTCLLLPQTPPLPELFQSWSRVRAPSEHFSLSYNRCWLHVDMADSWLNIFEKCRSRDTSKDTKMFQLLFSLPVMVFKNEEYEKYIPAMVSAFCDHRLKRPALPDAAGNYFDFRTGTAPVLDNILSRLKDSVIPATDTRLWNIVPYDDESDEDYRRRRKTEYNARLKHASLQIANFFSGKWNSWMQGHRTLNFPTVADGNLFNHARVIEKITCYFRDCNQNRLLLEHAEGVQSILNENFHDAISWDVPEFEFPPCDPHHNPHLPFDALSVLFERAPPVIIRREEELWGNVDQYYTTTESTSSGKLGELLAEMQRSTLALRRKYAKDLQDSQMNLTSLPSLPSITNIPFNIHELKQHEEACATRLLTSLERIIAVLKPLSIQEKAIASAGLWPRITLKALLRQLARPVNANLTNEWREVLLYIGRDTLEYQRSTRLLSYAQQGKREDFFREIDTHVYDMASAIGNPDWTLIQIEGNFLARPLQVRVAQEMITPSSNANTVLQLNMGEGKSSVIVPLVAAALAKGDRVVRVVVLKPLAGQMFQLLVERLSGLANRRIFYMPFSRKIRVGRDQINLIQRNYEICMREGGVWIVQPEHILSFKLMSIDRSLVSDNEIDRLAAEQLNLSQQWLDKNSRDILDESDEILHIRYQLVYTVGQQQPLELHPDRWTIAEELFTFVSRHVDEVKVRSKIGIDIESSVSGSFAPVRILDIEAGRDLVEKVVEDIFSGCLSSFNVRFLPEAMQTLAREFITEEKVEDASIQELRQHCGGGNDWKHLLLLRGLIAHGILIYALKERQYRVDYGLDLSRSLLAVPYRAKDVPSIRAEFGHPDVAVVLTCLSYYYEGLSSVQVKLCFGLLFKLDNPPLEYKMWVDGDPTVPNHLRTLNGINTDDADQHGTHIIPLFSKRKTVVDFYLSHVVFPKAAKEFPHKLSSSGWDLAEAKPGHVTTGFSGTNDNRFLLPTSISQQDPLQQNGTNAKVLSHLLQKENNHYRCAAQEDGGHPPVKRFLEILTQETSNSQVQVLLDVGAQMLDLKNDALAREWLKLRPDMAAAIFFNDNDEMIVVSQDGTEELLISSPFKGQLERVLVYLDDAHTRGTDLKLPIKSRAAVTLGPKVTKDRLIQGCMRMRKLGYGQSVIFFAPSEIDRAIRDLRREVSRDANVHTVDILRWSMYETCKDIAHHVPHWAEQGWDYLRRRKAWEEFTRDSAAAQATEGAIVNPGIDTLKKVWMREEARSLEKMYGHQTGPATTGLGGADMNMRESILATPELRERLELLGVKELKEVNVDEEQEREVSHEIERETHIERPPRVTPAQHQLSEGIKHFIHTGVLPTTEDSSFRKSFIKMFHSIEDSVKKSPSNGQDVWSPGLYVTVDFASTISARDAVERGGNAEYLRPLNWILTSRRYATNNVMIGVSPYEANELLPDIRKSTKVNLHVYAPRVTKDMLPLDDLRFYTVPKIDENGWVVPRMNIISQLNLFAGQLYLGNHDIYVQLCQFLGLDCGDGKGETEERIRPTPMEVDGEPYAIQSDGFVRPGPHREPMGMLVCRFVESPVPFLQELFGLRRKGTGFLPTHLGRIVHGRLLKQEDFDY